MVSPLIPNSSRLVASRRTRGQRRMIASAVLAQPPIRCSQLSSTIRTSWGARASSRVSSTGRPGCDASRSASEILGATASSSKTAASSTSQTPSPDPSSSPAATCRLNLVLPHPPAPVRVTRREDSTRARTSASSRSRPINLDNWAGRLFCSADAPVAWPCLAASTSVAGRRPRAVATNSARTGSARPSASASSPAVSLWAVRWMPRSKSLTDRGDRLAASASSSCVSPASARSRRSNPANPGPGCSATVLDPLGISARSRQPGTDETHPKPTQTRPPQPPRQHWPAQPPGKLRLSGIRPARAELAQPLPHRPIRAWQRPHRDAPAAAPRGTLSTTPARAGRPARCSYRSRRRRTAGNDHADLSDRHGPRPSEGTGTGWLADGDASGTKRVPRIATGTTGTDRLTATSRNVYQDGLGEPLPRIAAYVR